VGTLAEQHKKRHVNYHWHKIMQKNMSKKTHHYGASQNDGRVIELSPTFDWKMSLKFAAILVSDTYRQSTFRTPVRPADTRIRL
jgi:hypothetical protein